MNLHNFKQLEDKINRLIEQNASLKEQNKDFLVKLGKMDQDIQKLNDNMKKLYEERNLVYAKVADIIGRLEGIDLSD
ncbi:MAG: cell division protein ZapB [Thermodesulfobacteriota bacterium]|nr:cell division protein ZapB [Thermodesulfobacteriota bacterium]